MDAAFPTALDGLAMGALGLGLACAALFALDRQAGSGRKGNLIWPLAAAFGALLWLLFYLREGRADVRLDSVSAMAPASTEGAGYLPGPGVGPGAQLFALGRAWLSIQAAAPTPRRRTVGAASAGAASLVAWQLGMYAFLAFGQITSIAGGRL